MDNLLYRLRQTRASGCEFLCAHDGDMLAAAAEIERLRAEIERLRIALEDISGFKSDEENDDADTCADIALRALDDILPN